MSKMTWSKAQEAAINAKGKNYLISAGAGSGKTAVLTERIYKLVKEGASISKFLVLTFTNAAAAEMKIRVRKKLLDDPELANLAVAIENSHIETFDAFCLFIAKKYAFELGITANVSILDGTLLEIKKRKIIENILDELYEKKDENLSTFITNYCAKDDDVLKDLILRISHVGDLQIDRNGFYENFINNFFDDKKLAKIVDEKFASYIKDIQYVYDMSDKLENVEDGDTIKEVLSGLLSSKDYDELYYKLKDSENYSFPRKKGKGFSDGNFRDYLKDTYNAIIPANDNDFGTKDEIISSYLANKELVKMLIDITMEVENRLDAFKKESGAYSFADVARFALKALHIEQIRKEMSELFDFIMVDEYQDTSDIQEEVINLLGKNNIYMVGDVKQSIYRFRNANCGIFQDKYNSYKDGIGGEKIDLNTSYRSRREIVDMVNDVFSKIMKKEYNIIDYSDGHHFGFGLNCYDDLVDDKANYNLKVINWIKQKGQNTSEIEANLIANDILSKIGRISCYDKETKGLRPSSYKDYAILIDRSSGFDTYRRVFSQRGIPLRVISDEPVKDSEVSYVTKNLLVMFNSIANQQENSPEFKHAYVALSRSFLWTIDDQEILDTIRNNGVSTAILTEKVRKLVNQMKYASSKDILDALYTEFDLYNKVYLIGNVSSNIHKAELFLSLAASMDELSFSLDDFVNYFNDLAKYELDVAFSDGDASEDAVTLITMHKSKGLEYPFCYFPGFNKTYYNPDVKTSFLVSEKYGITLPIAGDSTQANLFNSLYKSEELQQDFEEKLRLLYVGLTRARESATIVLAHEENEKDIPDFRTVKSFGQIIRFLGLDNTNDYEVMEDVGSAFDIDDAPTQNVVFKSINAIGNPVGLRKRASKEIVEDVDDSLLEFGTRLHYLLEVANYETKDVSFIKENNLKKYVSNVLNCGLFDNVKNSQVLHEYSFFNEETNTNGIIDCMVISDNEIKIIDFKLKKISDEKYNKQLNIYADYIQLLSNKSIKLYLISSITGEVKEIERT